MDNTKVDPTKTLGGFAFELTDPEFEQIRKLVYDKVGINLTEKKKTLVVSRLQKILRQKNLSTFSEYFNLISTQKSGKDISDFIDQISTNHTYFYREHGHFEYMTKVALPEIIGRIKASNQKILRIWCAASSTGEEPYTLAMLVIDFLGREHASWDTGILATDISSRALATAEAGIYKQESMEKLPLHFQTKYFTKLPEGMCEVKPILKKEVTFRRFNLMNTHFPFKRSFDIIFCRNVMIYFDGPTRNTLVAKMYNFTQSQGYIFIGHSETLGRESSYTYIQPAIFKRSI